MEIPNKLSLLLFNTEGVAQWAGARHSVRKVPS